MTNRTNHGDYYANNEAVRRFYLQFFGVSLNMADKGTYNRITTDDRYKDMGVFPTKDSVKIIDGVMVVNMSGDPLVAY